MSHATEDVAYFAWHGCCAGDVERDFWLAYELLQNPKDHAEFTIVRNWVQKALQVGTQFQGPPYPILVLSTELSQHYYGMHSREEFHAGCSKALSRSWEAEPYR